MLLPEFNGKKSMRFRYTVLEENSDSGKTRGSWEENF